MTLERGALAHDAFAASHAGDAPATPLSIADTGLKVETVVALLLKTLYTSGPRTGGELTRDLRLPFMVLDPVLLELQQRHFLQVLGVHGLARGSYEFDLTTQGRARAQEAMTTNQYVGPAPVPVDEYRRWVLKQSIHGVAVSPGAIREGLGHMVLSGEILNQVGPAMSSGRSMFLYGAAGNGKTELAHAIGRMLQSEVYQPFAFEVDGHVVVLHDPAQQDPQGEAEPSGRWLADEPEYDPRFARMRRPVMFAGGELTLEQLDLRYDPNGKFYRAPLHVKANGGVLIVDDLGRQRMRPEELLNRWMVPLEQRLDYLTLHTGFSFAIPFDCLVIFSTNLEPTDLVDEAFLRRIHYKIHLDSPTREQYEEIFRRCCEARMIPFEAEAVERIWEDYYEAKGIPPRACHPRDILSHLGDLARFMHLEPRLTEEMLGSACRAYFLTR